METYEISHFFLGKVSDHSKFNDFLEEDYERDDEVSLSKFCESQRELFIDHDFLEVGTRDDEVSLEQFFEPYSYSERWSDELIQKAKSLQLTDANALIFVSKEQIKAPKTVSVDGFDLIYVGELKYPI